jgi:hypothetical protein
MAKKYELSVYLKLKKEQQNKSKVSRKKRGQEREGRDTNK